MLDYGGAADEGGGGAGASGEPPPPSADGLALAVAADAAAAAAPGATMEESPMHKVAKYLLRANEMGLELSSEAMQALSGVAPERAAELLEFAVSNHGTGMLTDPSGYIVSTCAQQGSQHPPRGGPPPAQWPPPAPPAAAAGGPNFGAALQAAQANSLQRCVAGGFGTADVNATSSIADGVAALCRRAQDAGLPVSPEAQRALATLPLIEHAEELVDFVMEKRDTLRDPSNYIASTIARGFKPRRGGGGGGPGGGLPPAPPPPAGQASPHAPAGGALGLATGAAGWSAEQAVVQAQAVGVELTEEALRALEGLPAEHATELLDFVLADGGGRLRNPSNYIVSTIARGFVPRRGSGPGFAAGGGAAIGGLGGGAADAALDQAAAAAVAALRDGPSPAAAGPPAERPAVATASPPPPALGSGGGGGLGSGGRGEGHFLGGGAGRGSSPRLIPPDVTALELRVLDFNMKNLFGGQQLDFQSYMALRCIVAESAAEMLDSMELKTRRGGAVISSPNNYVQAAVTKISRGQGTYGPSAAAAAVSAGAAGLTGTMPSGFSGRTVGEGAPPLSLTGSRSGRRAKELGLELNEAALQALATVPLRDAFTILDLAAAQASSLYGEDPSAYVVEAAHTAAASAQQQGTDMLGDENLAKRTRVW